MKLVTKIAKERIDILMEMAEKEFVNDKERANRYAQLARKIAMKCSIRFPKKWKRRICKKCKCFLVPGVNSRTRIVKGMVIITCLECNNRIRIPIS